MSVPASQPRPVILPLFVERRTLQVALATSGFCNARCSSCIWPYMTGPNGVMKLNEFRTLLDHLEGFRFSEFAFNVINEPFTDRGISDKLRELARRHLDIECLFFSSNWLIPNEAQIADFVDAVEECVASPAIQSISLNATVSGIDDDSYDILQAGAGLEGTVSPYRTLDFGRAVANVGAVLRMLATRDLPSSVVFHIKAYGNAFTDVEMQEFWSRTLREQGVPEAFANRNVRVLLNHSFISFARADGRQARGSESVRRCRGRWMSEKVVVGPRGEVGLCCQDGLRDVRFGSLLQDNLLTVVSSEAFQHHHRIAIGREQPDTSHPCSRC
jgi:hypothetical protein